MSTRPTRARIARLAALALVAALALGTAAPLGARGLGLGTGPAMALAQDYETSPREEPENVEPPDDRNPEHAEDTGSGFPVVAVVVVIALGLVATFIYMWLRDRP